MATQTVPTILGASDRPDKPAMLNHVAYMTRDTAATAAFYTEILGMELAAAVMDDAIPSTGDPWPYFHSFFKLGDGSLLAFFEAPDVPAQAEATHPAYNVFQHIAFDVGSTEAVDAWKEWLEGKGLEVLGPVDHQIIYSIYFHDPNGIRLELTTATDPKWNDSADTAAASLQEWNEVKARSAATGESVVEALHGLAAERSHRAKLTQKD